MRRELSPPGSLVQASDDRLVRLAGRGSEAAFEAIDHRYRAALQAHVRRFGLSGAHAEDVAQQVLLACWTSLRRGQIEHLRGWLYRSAQNCAIDLLRRSAGPAGTLEGPIGVAEPADVHVERRAAVRRTLTGLAALPPRQREAMVQTAVEGRSYSEVAHMLGVSEGAVTQLVHRARTSLRLALQSIAPVPHLGAKLAALRDWASASASSAAGGVTYTKAAAVIGTTAAVASAPALVDRLDHGRAAGIAHAAAHAHAGPLLSSPAHPQRLALHAGRALSRPVAVAYREASTRSAPVRAAAPVRREQAKARIDARKDGIDARKDRLDRMKEHATPAQQARIDRQKDALDRQKDLLDKRKDRLDATGG
jgi:RNA polymerase sigma factor (sigma-70 family)